MIAAGAQAIIINAASPTALDPVVKKAQSQGIIVLAFDNIVETPGVVIVNEDQVEFGRMMADWLVKKLGGNGNILMVNGVAGTSVDADRAKGAKDVFAASSGIKIVAEVMAIGTQARLSRSPRPHSLPTPISMACGVRAAPTALCARSSRPASHWCRWPGRPRTASASSFLQLKDQGLSGSLVGQTPGMVAVCIRAAIDMLGGKELPQSISIPLPSATSEELQDGVNVFTNLPDNFFTLIQIAPCGVNLTVDQINAQQV